MDFATHRLSDGLFSDRRHISLEGPLAPGTLVIWYPETSGVMPRFGVIVGLVNAVVHMMWQPWTSDSSAIGRREVLGPPVKKRRHEK